MEINDLLRLVSVPGILGGGGVSYADLIASLNPTLWTRFDETSGSLINYGSDGNSATVSGAAQGQTGQLGANEAYLFDGSDDKCTFSNADITGTKALTTQRWMFLIKASSLGEADAGIFMFYGSPYRIRFSANNVLLANIDTTATTASATSNDNQVDFLTGWALVFVDYDDANELGLGRKLRLMRATTASATTLLTLATDTPGTGTVAAPSADLVLGNNATTTTTFDGFIDEALAGAGLWSPAGAPLDLTLCDQFRNAVFGV